MKYKFFPDMHKYHVMCHIVFGMNVSISRLSRDLVKSDISGTNYHCYD